MSDWQVELFNKYNDNYESDNYFLEILGNRIYVCKKPKCKIGRVKCVEEIFTAPDIFYEMRENFMKYTMWKYGFKLKKEVKQNEKLD